MRLGPLLCPLLAASLLPAQAPAPGLARLHRLRAGEAAQFSSADPSGGNQDRGNYLETLPDGSAVLARAAGAGRVVRIWSANPEGRIQVFIDGAQRPVLDAPFARLFDQSLPPFLAPLSAFSGGGGTCCVPIPFRSGLEIRLAPEAPGKPVDVYYQVGVERLEPGQVPASFAWPLPASLQAEIQELLAGAPPVESREKELAFRLGRPPLVLEEQGAGLIREMRFTALAGPASLDRVLLRIWWDGAAEPSLELPLSAFLGSAFGAPPPSTQAFAMEGSELVARWPMPFANGFRLELSSASATRPPLAGRLRLAPAPPAGSGRFHAAWRQEEAAPGRPITILETAGRGHFAGIFLAMQGRYGTGLSYLEGDERILVDGREAFLGTGTEDYFNAAWYFAGGPFSAPYNGLSVKTEHRIAVARLHIPDPIPFRERFAFTLEHGGTNNAPGTLYQAASFWYAERPGPAGSRLEGAWDFPREATERPLQAEELALPGGRLCAEGPLAASAEGGAWVRLEPAHGPVVGELGRFPSGAYRLVLRACGAGGWRIQALEAGRVLLEGRVGGAAFQETRLGLLRLEGSSLSLRLEPLGPDSAPLELDALALLPYLPAIRAWSICGPFPSPGSSGFDEPFAPEREPFDAKQPLAGIAGAGPRTWRPVDLAHSGTGYLDFNPLFDPKDYMLAYAVCFITAPEAQEADLVLGSDDGVKAWWNGELILRNQVHRGAGRDDERVAVRVARGENVLLLKVENRRGGWGLFARLEGGRDLSFSALPAGGQGAR